MSLAWVAFFVAVGAVGGYELAVLDTLRHLGEPIRRQVVAVCILVFLAGAFAAINRSCLQ
jgi:hypothetical protein